MKAAYYCITVTQVRSFRSAALAQTSMGAISVSLQGTSTINAVATLQVQFTITSLSSGDYFTMTVPSDLSWTEASPTTCTEALGNTVTCARTSTTVMKITAGNAMSGLGIFQISGIQNPNSVRAVSNLQLATFTSADVA